MGLFNGQPPKPRNLFTETHAPVQVAPKPSQKIGLAPRRREPERGKGWSQVTAGDPWGHLWRMRELMRRVKAGEELEAVKRELWADQYRGEEA